MKRTRSPKNGIPPAKGRWSFPSRPKPPNQCVLEVPSFGHKSREQRRRPGALALECRGAEAQTTFSSSREHILKTLNMVRVNSQHYWYVQSSVGKCSMIQLLWGKRSLWDSGNIRHLLDLPSLSFRSGRVVLLLMACKISFQQRKAQHRATQRVKTRCKTSFQFSSQCPFLIWSSI